MAGPGTTFTGPVMSGTQRYPSAATAANLGLCVLMQTATLGENGATNVGYTFNLPAGSRIIDWWADPLVIWNSGTSATLSLGASSGGADYGGGVVLSTDTARTRASWTDTELAAMASIGANNLVYALVTVVGTAATTGSTVVTILYVQNVELNVGAT